MERALALQALMREYGHDRQVCSQLLKGIERKQDRKKIQEDVLTFWLNHLQKHLDTEEHVLIPFLARARWRVSRLLVGPGSIRATPAGPWSTAAAMMPGKPRNSTSM